MKVKTLRDPFRLSVIVLAVVVAFVAVTTVIAWILFLVPLTRLHGGS